MENLNEQAMDQESVIVDSQTTDQAEETNDGEQLDLQRLFNKQKEFERKQQQFEKAQAELEEMKQKIDQKPAKQEEVWDETKQKEFFERVAVSEGLVDELGNPQVQLAKALFNIASGIVSHTVNPKIEELRQSAYTSSLVAEDQTAKEYIRMAKTDPMIKNLNCSFEEKIALAKRLASTNVSNASTVSSTQQSVDTPAISAPNMPQKQVIQKPNMSRSTGSTQTTKGKIVLTDSQKFAARNAGMSDDEYIEALNLVRSKKNGTVS